MNTQLPRVWGLLGHIGVGKTTVAEHLVATQGFHTLSFAGALRDTLSVIFNWPRPLLEGDTPTSRAWREQPDSWWSQRLGREITPRRMLQQLGTDCLREHFHPDIWVASLEHRLTQALASGKSVVISDCRFANEIALVRQYQGCLVEVQRGPRPAWWSCAQQSARAWQTPDWDQLWARQATMTQLWPEVHLSEWAWAAVATDHTLNNHHSREVLFADVRRVLEITHQL